MIDRCDFIPPSLPPFLCLPFVSVCLSFIRSRSGFVPLLVTFWRILICQVTSTSTTTSQRVTLEIKSLTWSTDLTAKKVCLETQSIVNDISLILRFCCQVTKQTNKLPSSSQSLLPVFLWARVPCPLDHLAPQSKGWKSSLPNNRQNQRVLQHFS